VFGEIDIRSFDSFDFVAKTVFILIPIRYDTIEEFNVDSKAEYSA